MRERFIVANQSKDDAPEFNAVYWAQTKEEAVDEAQRRKRMFPEEAKDVLLLKVLNIPQSNNNKPTVEG